MAATAASEVTEGPVLSFINKRLRALRKKLNRITQLEEGIAQGKPIKKEQEDVLRSKPSIAAAIDELEKLREPLSIAVSEEVALAIQGHNNDAVEDTKDNHQTLEESENENKVEKTLEDKTAGVEDLLYLLYFASMFDVKSQSDFTSIMLTRTHERKCCLTYDCVTDDDAAVILDERDLDLISMMGSLLISRPMDSSLSHQNALQRCIEHAKLWLAKSEQPIDPNSTVTYAGLRETLTKIIASNFFTITPEMKAMVDVAAAAAGNYASFQVPTQVEDSVAQYQQEEEVGEFQGSETYDDQSHPMEEHHKDDLESENAAEISAQTESTKPQTEPGVEFKEQQYAPRRGYRNQRGGGRSGGGGGYRGYPNGRGGRSGGRGGGMYQNGRNQYYEQPGNYHPRNYNNGRGRGGRGSGGNFYNNASGVEAAES